MENFSLGKKGMLFLTAIIALLMLSLNVSAAPQSTGEAYVEVVIDYVDSYYVGKGKVPDAAAEVYLGESSSPLEYYGEPGHFLIQVADSDGNPILDNSPSRDVPGIHIARDTNTKGGTFLKITTTGDFYRNSFEVFEFRIRAINSRFVGFENPPTSPRYQKAHNGVCGIDKGNLLESILTEDEVFGIGKFGNDIVETYQGQLCSIVSEGADKAKIYYEITGNYDCFEDYHCDDSDAGTIDSCQMDNDGSQCEYTNVPDCGNGIVEADEFCDDGSLNGQYRNDGQTGYCNSECTGLAAHCGDGNVDSNYGEECDDGNSNNYDDCSNICEVVESGEGYQTCEDSDGLDYLLFGSTTVNIFDEFDNLIDTEVESDLCRNSDVLVEQTCNNDGTSSSREISCALEFGAEYYCSESQGRCVERTDIFPIITYEYNCLDSDETIANAGLDYYTAGNVVGDIIEITEYEDGTITRETTFEYDDSDYCTPNSNMLNEMYCLDGEPVLFEHMCLDNEYCSNGRCILIDDPEPSNCGNGLIDNDETCDDGNSEPGDGCSDYCTIEPGWICEGEPSVCTRNNDPSPDDNRKNVKRSSKSDNDDDEDSDNCVATWDCSTWSECSDGIQTRTCSDVKHCSTFQYNKPNEIQGCEDDSSMFTNTIELGSENPEPTTLKSKVVKSLPWILVVGIIILILLIIVFLII